MAKNKKNQNGVSTNPTKEATKDTIVKSDSISAWSWLFSNFGAVIVAIFIILPFGLYKAWGTGSEWLPIGSFVIIGTICLIAGRRQYKQLVKSGDVRPF